MDQEAYGKEPATYVPNGDKMKWCDLKKTRMAEGLTQEQMAEKLRTPLRTYQCWESGENRIPGVVEVALELIAERGQWVMNQIAAKLLDRADRDFPGGRV